ncbi:redoxin domain-containing protein [Tundrisphaera lichenicola]|uniref:redoxin domain-containing protein n=1 Tax=Tundrisphaera lichenicola TaxID=2029860 RepID=UPI003EC03BC5
MPLRIVWTFGLCCIAFGTASAQEPSKPTASPSAADPSVPAPGHSIHGEAYNDGPRRRAALIPNMGKVDFPVTTSKPEAQEFITQGVAQLHSFYYFEAERSFRQAAMIDPVCSMASWGLAMANVNNAKRATGFVKEARTKADASKPSRREILYIESLEALYKESGNDKAKKKAHLLGLETLVQEFPEDLEARAWLAMVTWQNASSDGIGSRQAVDLLLQSVLDKNPMHPGAHHYRIHLWDHVKPNQALQAASLFAPSASGIAHAWHMPGHTYTELKRYADAAYQQEGSARVDHAYMIRDRVMPFEIHNYAHNNQWLATSLGNVGRVRDAIIVARNLVEQPRDPQKNGPNDGGSPQRSGRQRWAEMLVNYELWDDLIAATDSGELDWADIPNEKIEKPYTLGLAYAARGDAAKLEEQAKILTTMVAEETKKANDKAPTSGTLVAALAELEGYQKYARGEALQALESFAKATRMNSSALVRLHLANRNFGLAEAAAKVASEKNANQFVPMAALVEAYHASGKDDLAREAYRNLQPYLARADQDTPIARRLASIVDGWKADGQWSPTPLDASTDEATATTRIDLETLGPIAWSPWPAEPIDLVDTDGKPWTLADHKGRNVIVLFYLGDKCAHCLQQLQEFGKQMKAFDELGTDLVAVGTDDLEMARLLKSNADGIKFPMPLLADPSLAVFKKYQAFDDFEGLPLHGAYLIDREGNVRFQRISADPFLEIDFLKGEASRINKLLK